MHNGPIRDDLFDGTLNGYQKAATTTAIYPGKGTALGLIYIALKSCGEAGEFAEHVSKAMRDDGFANVGSSISGEACIDGLLTTERHFALVKEVGDQLWYLAAKCNELGMTLEEVAKVNLMKLKDRQARGTLSGSGDDR